MWGLLQGEHSILDERVGSETFSTFTLVVDLEDLCSEGLGAIMEKGCFPTVLLPPYYYYVYTVRGETQERERRG